MKHEIIERKYLDDLISVIGTRSIKILTGIRRCGKSTILDLFKVYLSNNIDNINIIFINFNDLKFEDLLDYKKMNKYILDNYIDKKVNFLIVDEIQLCKKFELVINSLFETKRDLDIYLTGSNAFLLSSNLSTLFTGRTYDINIFPFSFFEFAKYNKLSNYFEDFNSFFIEGGMPTIYDYDKLEYKFVEAKVIFDTILKRDIFYNKKIRDRILFERLILFLLDNIGNITSIKNITKVLNTNGEKTNDKKIARYISYACEAFLFYKIKRYDIKGKKLLYSSDKYYATDHIFRTALLGNKSIDYGRVYENIVAIELLRRNYEVYVGYLKDGEIDFVAIRREEKIYIQVSYDIDNKETFNREIKPLLKLGDATSKILIARTKQPKSFYEGVWIYDISDWLLEENLK